MAPFGRGIGPSAFYTTGNSIRTYSGPIVVLPSKALGFYSCSRRFCFHIFSRICGTMGFTKGMPPGNKCHGFVIVHSHTAKSIADIMCGLYRVRIGIMAFRVYINQSHVGSTQRSF